MSRIRLGCSSWNCRLSAGGRGIRLLGAASCQQGNDKSGEYSHKKLNRSRFLYAYIANCDRIRDFDDCEHSAVRLFAYLDSIPLHDFSTKMQGHNKPAKPVAAYPVNMQGRPGAQDVAARASPRSPQPEKMPFNKM